MLTICKRGFSPHSRKDARKFSLQNYLKLGAALIAGSLTVSTPVHATTTPVVKTDAGKVQGYINNYGVDAFLGIPYAAPPVGNLRWRPPVKHVAWKGVLPTMQFGPECAQIYELGAYGGLPNNNEDCLYLNVYTPQVKSSAKLPVILFIHGSGTAESGDDYDGSKLASQGHTVVVTINYRLNLFGELAVPALDHEGHLFGNYSVLDHQMALKWVKDNIANFGGNPNNVTVSGQSQGSQFSVAEILSPLGKGLFDKAILMSGAGYASVTPLSLSEQIGTNFVNAAGCGAPNYTTDTAVAKCLRGLSAAQVEALAGNGIAYYDHGIYAGDTGGSPYTTGMIADGQILPTAEVQALQTGQFNHVPILSGNTEQEFTFNVAPVEFYETPRKPLTEAQEQAFVSATFSGPAGPGNSPPNYPAGTVAAVNAEYPLSAYPSPQLQWSALDTDYRKTCVTRFGDNILAPQVPLYIYDFRDQSAPDYFPPMPDFATLAYHTGDIQYYFPLYRGGALGKAHPLNAQQQVLSDQLVAAWTNFMYTGNPNGQGSGPWPLYAGTKNGTWFTENLKSPPNIVAKTYSPPITIPASKPAGLSTVSDASVSAEHHCDFWAKYLQYGP
jgi:para-nitrobenzyl esterase